MRRSFILLTTLLLTFCMFSIPAFAQEAQSLDTMPTLEENPSVAGNYQSDFFIGRVIEIIKQEEKESSDGTAITQDVKIRFVTGSQKGQEVDIAGYFSSLASKKLNKNDQVIINHVTTADGEEYFIADKYRTPSSIMIAVLFFALVIIFARLKGVTSILGLIFSLIVLFGFVVPQILSGQNPLLMSLIGCLLIALLSLYLAHGFNKQTSIALLATLISLVLSTGLAIIFVGLTRLSGAGSEESFFLQSGMANNIDLHGLLLGGIIIGALGVLDDITTGQTAAINQIHRANPSMGFIELYRSGLAVGHEHIASLVNTLVLAYVGASFPLILLFAVNGNIQPLWVTVNSEFITEEIVRTLVGSTTLVFAVPIATALAAWFLHKEPVSGKAHGFHGGHSHS